MVIHCLIYRPNEIKNKHKISLFSYCLFTVFGSSAWGKPSRKNMYPKDKNKERKKIKKIAANIFGLQI